MAEIQQPTVKRASDIVRVVNTSDKPLRGRFDGTEYPLDGPIPAGKGKLLQRYIAEHIVKQHIERNEDGSQILKRFLEIREVEGKELDSVAQPDKLNSLMDQNTALEAENKSLKQEKSSMNSAMEILRDETNKALQEKNAKIEELLSKVSELSKPEKTEKEEVKEEKRKSGRPKGS